MQCNGLRTGVVSLVVVVCVPRVVVAEQILLVDRTFMQKQSHVATTIRQDVPQDWRLPVNYAQGTMYVKLEVRKKPDATTRTIFQICLATRKDHDYVCANYFNFSKAGFYKWSQPFPFPCCSAGYNYDAAPSLVVSIVKNAQGGLVESGPYYPLDLRLRVWVVEKGGSFDETAAADGGAASDVVARPNAETMEAGQVDASVDRALPVVPQLPPPDVQGAIAELPGSDASADSSGLPPQRVSSGCRYGAGGDTRCPAVAALLLAIILLGRTGARRMAGTLIFLSVTAADLAGCMGQPVSHRGMMTGGMGGDALGGASGAGDNGGGAGSPGGAPALPGIATPRFARLSHQQWENTVRDLLRLDALPAMANTFEGDAITGFDNNADQLVVSDNLRSDYERAAETLAARLAANPAQLAKILPVDLPADPAAKARAFIRSFGLRAYRRPLGDDEVENYLALFARGQELTAGKDAFAAGVELSLSAFLQSVHFLYRSELGTVVTGGRIALGDHEIAAKLSYALTGTMPDDALFAAAAKGVLQNSTGRLNEAQRLLDGATGDAALDRFHHQYYQVALYSQINKDEKLFPQFAKYRATLPSDMQREAVLYTRDVVKQQKGVADLLTSPYTFANTALASVYGVAGTFPADSLARVDLDPAQRSGLLTRLGFLASRASDLERNSIQRGVFVNEVILCKRLPMPPPGAAATPPPLSPGVKTNRQLVELRTGKGTCGEACHGAIINPAGFPFEHYDALGKFQAADHGLAINAADTYPFDLGAQSSKDAIEFSRLLAGAPEAHACYASNLLSYLHGREIHEGAGGDDPWIAQLAARSRAGTLPIKALILELVTDPVFVTRTP